MPERDAVGETDGVTERDAERDTDIVGLGVRERDADTLSPPVMDGDDVGEREVVGARDADPDGERDTLADLVGESDTLADVLAPNETERLAVGEREPLTLGLAAGQPKPRVHVGVAELVTGGAEPDREALTDGETAATARDLDTVDEGEPVTLGLAAGQPKPRVHVGVAELVTGEAV